MGEVVPPAVTEPRATHGDLAASRCSLGLLFNSARAEAGKFTVRRVSHGGGLERKSEQKWVFCSTPFSSSETNPDMVASERFSIVGT